MVECMSIEHRRLHVAMTQQLLDSSHVRAVFDQVCGKGMEESSSLDEISQDVVEQAKIRWLIPFLPASVLVSRQGDIGRARKPKLKRSRQSW